MRTQACCSSGETNRVQQHSQLYCIAKRVLDILIAGVALVLSFPLGLVIAIAVMVDSPGPAIFRQLRVGAKRADPTSATEWNHPPLILYKFRTMHQNSDSSIHRAFMQAFIKNDQPALTTLQGGHTDTKKLVDDPRVTRVGRLLRRTSLDELPQLWNVLKGDMTLVGPRPAIQYEVDEYASWHFRRLNAKPGLTGMWQVTKRSAADFDEMARLDIWYIEHQSLWLDLKILAKTVYVVFSGKGAF